MLASVSKRVALNEIRSTTIKPTELAQVDGLFDDEDEVLSTTNTAPQPAGVRSYPYP